jgi:uncharacterized protein
LGGLNPLARLTAEALNLKERAVAAALELFDGGATVPFVARYRKEATLGLDEVELRAIQQRAKYFRELEERKRTALDQIRALGKLSPELAAAIEQCRDKATLEDLYLPFKPKRRSKATIAQERGLEPLANLLWGQAEPRTPEACARSFVDEEREVPSTAAALEGARDICAERIAEDPEVRRKVREALERGQFSAKKRKAFRDQKTKYDNYENYRESLQRAPAHRVLALGRGEDEGVLQVKIELDTERLLGELLRRFRRRGSAAWSQLLDQAIEDALSRLLLPTAKSALRSELVAKAELGAVEIFAKNLRGVLMAAPLGAAWVLGIDPGQRTGAKCAVVDDTGALKHHTLLNLVHGDKQLAAARVTLQSLIERFPLRAIAVGNGTHGRETEQFVRDVLQQHGATQIAVVSINEAGASVYSASDLARQELPDQDVTVRGAVSIARRLQDPLAELVKVDPKSLGVGQYQHDVSGALLAEKLADVVESCVNSVGVDLNTASPSLLGYVSGVGPKLAARIVEHRESAGRFPNRRALLQVKGLGARTFEQAAGFLRVAGSLEPLDNTGVHPERYGLVQRMAKDAGLDVSALLGNPDALQRLSLGSYQSDDVGDYTLQDILLELEKPGRDPRSQFEAPRFRSDIKTIEDLREGMQLEGTVSNVTAFGAFVDLGVHQDGLVHISQLADRFVKDPNEVVQVGDRISVRVLAVDLQRKRISLSAKGL